MGLREMEIADDRRKREERKREIIKRDKMQKRLSFKIKIKS